MRYWSKRFCRKPCLLIGFLSCAAGVGGAPSELVDLSRKRPTPCFELEQHSLGSLTREPQLATLWIPADAVLGHSGTVRSEQVGARNDRDFCDDLLRISADEDEHRSQSGGACALDEPKPTRGIVSHERRRAMPERSCNSSFLAGGNVDQREGETLAFFGQRPGGGCEPFAFCECLLECRETLTRELRPCHEIVTLAGCNSSRLVSSVGRAAELGWLVDVGPSRGCESLRDLVEQTLHRFVADFDRLCDTAQREQRTMSALGELRLGEGPRGQRLVDVGEDSCPISAFMSHNSCPLLFGFELDSRTIRGGGLRG
jgi:hypothetical protein